MDYNEYEREEDIPKVKPKQKVRSGNRSSNVGVKGDSNRGTNRNKSNNKSVNKPKTNNKGPDTSKPILENNYYEDIDLNVKSKGVIVNKSHVELLNEFNTFYKNNINEIMIEDVKKEILRVNKNITKVKVFTRFLLMLHDELINNLLTTKIFPQALNTQDIYYIKKVVKMSKKNEMKARLLLDKYLTNSNNKVSLKAFDSFRFVGLSYLPLFKNVDMESFLKGYSRMYLGQNKKPEFIQKDIERIILSNCVHRLNKINILELNSQGCTLEDLRKEKLFYNVGNLLKASDLDEKIALCLESARVRKGLSNKKSPVVNKDISVVNKEISVVNKAVGDISKNVVEKEEAVIEEVKKEVRKFTKAEASKLEDFITIYEREILYLEEAGLKQLISRTKIVKANKETKKLENEEVIKVIYPLLMKKIYELYKENIKSQIRNEKYDKSYITEIVKIFDKDLPKRYLTLIEYSDSFKLKLDVNMDLLYNLDKIISGLGEEEKDNQKLGNKFLKLYEIFLNGKLNEDFSNDMINFINSLKQYDMKKLLKYGFDILEVCDNVEDEENSINVNDIDSRILNNIYNIHEAKIKKILLLHYKNSGVNSEIIQQKYESIKGYLTTKKENLSIKELPELFSFEFKTRNEEVFFINPLLIMNLLNNDVYYDKEKLLSKEKIAFKNIKSGIENDVELQEILKNIKTIINSTVKEVIQTEEDIRRLKRFAFLAYRIEENLTKLKFNVYSKLESNKKGVYIGLQFKDTEGSIKNYKLTTTHIIDMDGNTILFKRDSSDAIVKEFLEFGDLSKKKKLLKLSGSQSDAFWRMLEIAFDLRKTVKDEEGALL